MKRVWVILLGLAASSIFGQTELTVLANRLPATPDTVGATVTIVHPTQDLVDALSRVPGLTIHSEGAGAFLSPAGFGENGFARLTILVDGVPYNNPDMAPPDLNSIPWQTVQRVEVYSNSVWWGGLGTVINIITKKPNLAVGGQISAGVDDRLGHHENLQISVPSGQDFAISLDAQNAQTISAQASNNSWNPSASLAMFWRGSGFETTAHLDYSRRLFDLPGSLTQAQFESNPNQVGSYGSIDNSIVENRASLLATGSAFGGNFDLPVGFFSRRVDEFLSTILTQGMAGFHEKWLWPVSSSDYWGLQTGVDETESVYLNHTQTTSAGGVSLVWSLAQDSFLVQVLARPQIFTNDGAIRTDIPMSASLVGNFVAKGLGSFHAKLTGAQTVREPLLDEEFNLYGSLNFAENPNLMPETGRLLDASLEADLGAWSFRVAPTLMWLDNQITYVTNASYIGQNVNLSGTSTHTTVIALASWHPAAWATVTGSYTWTDARDASGNELPLVSAHTVRLAGDTSWGGVSWTWFSSYAAFGSSQVINPRSQLDAYLKYSFSGGWSLKAIAMNLLDDRTPSEVYYSYAWYPVEARTFELDVAWSF